MKNFLISFSLIALVATAYSKGDKMVTLEDIWLKGTFAQKSVYGLNSMEDGAHYTVLETNEEDVQVIMKYSYEKKKAVGEILENNLKTEDGQALRIEGYSFSKDESKILIRSMSERIYRHSMRSAYFIYDLNNKSLQRIGTTKFQLAEFSPDGKWVSFVRDNNLYIYEISSARETAITKDGVENKIINGAPDWVYEEEFTLVKAYEWSNDSKCLAYYRFDESQVRQFSFPIYGSLYPENYVFKYPKAGEANSKVSIYFHHLDGRTFPVVSPLDYEYIPRIQWHPTNGMLAVHFMNRLQNNLDVRFSDRETGETFALFSEQSETYLEVQDIVFLESEDAFLWMSERSGKNQIYKYQYSASLEEYDVDDRKPISSEDYVVTDIIGYNQKEDVVYYAVSNQYSAADRQYIRQPVNSENGPEDFFPFPDGISSVSASKTLDYFVVQTSSAMSPLTVSVFNRLGQPVKDLEDNEELNETLKDYSLSRKEFFKFKNRNGDELVGWMIKPADFDPVKKYPVLMYVYGGPGSQTVLNRWGGSNFMWYQYLAQKGYVIVSVDNRGTGARSSDFRTCTYGQLGKLESEDQIDAARYLAKQSYVDESRIGIWGWSYGGYMSTLCLAKGADVFKMAIAVAPVTNWRYYDTIYTERYMGLPGKKGSAYDENSPIYHAEKIKGKYLLVHGSADDNVHFQNTMELVDVMVKKNVDFDLAVYPNKNHGIYGGNTRYHLFSKMSNFIFTNL